MRKHILLFALALLATGGVLPLNTYAMDPETTPMEKEQQAALKKVEHQYVCMVNNSLFNTVQIPVEVDGKTYYGCCAGCEATLKTDPSSRMAIDPVSGKEVDKATCVIGADASGNTFYFENEENLMAYQPPAE